MDVDSNSATPMRYGVRGIPTLLVFKGGQVKEQIVGYVPKETIQKAIDKHVKSSVVGLQSSAENFKRPGLLPGRLLFLVVFVLRCPELRAESDSCLSTSATPQSPFPALLPKPQAR